VFCFTHLFVPRVLLCFVIHICLFPRVLCFVMRFCFASQGFLFCYAHLFCLLGFFVLLCASVCYTGFHLCCNSVGKFLASTLAQDSVIMILQLNSISW
jgi:hypothetical protein